MKSESNSEKSVVKKIRAGIAAVRKSITRKPKTTEKIETASTAKTAKTRAPKKSPGKTMEPAPVEAAPSKQISVEKVEEKAPVAKTSRKSTRKAPVPVPSILLEGDQPSPSPLSGPGRKFALTPDVPAPQSATPEMEVELPEAYGTKKLFLAARDPHWLYAHWDLTAEQLKKLNSLSADKHLVLRIYVDKVGGAPGLEIHVHPESRHWFVHVDKANTRYASELGYYAGTNRRWKRVCVSGATLTPPDAMSDDLSILFATIPIDLPFPQLVSLVKDALRHNISLVTALEQLRAEGHSQLPGKSVSPSRWTPAQEKALAAVLSMDEVRRVWLGSLEITELIRRQLGQEISSMSFSPLGGFSSFSSLGSPFGGLPGQKGFWFNVNAELIIYGATEPDATVTIGGRQIKLRADGSFSYRFALPDGKYELPAVAVSADKTDARAAELSFSRDTHYHGEVGMHPQDPQLKLPHAANVA